MKLPLITIFYAHLAAGTFAANIENSNITDTPTINKIINYGERIAYESMKLAAKKIAADNFITFTHEMGHALMAKALHGSPINIVLGISSASQMPADQFLLKLPSLGINLATLHWKEGYASCGVDPRLWAEFLVNIAGGTSAAVNVYALSALSGQSWSSPFFQLSELPYEHENLIEYLSDAAFVIYVYWEVADQLLYAFLPTVFSSSGSVMVLQDYDGVKAMAALGVPLSSVMMAKLGHMRSALSASTKIFLTACMLHQFYHFAPYLIESEINFWSH